MYYSIQNGSLCKWEERPPSNMADCQVLIGIHSCVQNQVPNGLHFLKQTTASDIFSRSSFRFESHEGFDLICFPLLVKDRWFSCETDSDPKQNQGYAASPSYIFLLKNEVHFCLEHTDSVTDLFDSIGKEWRSDGQRENPSSEILHPGTLLYRYFSRQTADDLGLLEALEIGLNSLEEEVLTDHATNNYTRKFVTIRKHLMRIKRYYEQLLEILNDIAASENALIDKTALQQFRLLSKRTDRLYQKTLNLMDYVSEIREAYQAEVDISLNKTMKILTVITVIVLPLTLIAGWYGMNFPMPEYQSPWGYPAIIFISLAIVILFIFYFKKHKWF